MEQTFARILMLLSLSAAFSKYVYIPERMNWFRAQQHCQMHHTDLAPVSSTHDSELLGLATDNKGYIWIGLRRNFLDKNKWTWSGGVEVTKFLWDQGQPENQTNEDYGLIHNFMWHDATPFEQYTFFCYRAIAVREKKTWEEALEYCREHHHDLASVASATEMLLIQKELNNTEATARVWIGLRFFPEGWLWVDKQPLDYEAWGQEGKPECPFKQRCAALQVTGEYPSCKLHGGYEIITAAATVAPNPFDTYVCDVEVGEWEARDCVEKLPFICY